MKSTTHIVITHIAFLALFSGAALAFAQSDNVNRETQNNAVPPEVKSEIQEKVTEKKAEITEKGKLLRVHLQEKSQQRVLNLAANISNRIDASIERLQNITDRLSSRIEKISEEGIDTSEAEASLALAQTSINAAVEAMENIDFIVDSAIKSEDVYTAWKEVRSTITETKSSLKIAKTELRAAVASLKAELLKTKEGNGVSEAVQRQNKDLDLQEVE